jgi:uncharacterized NAD(P)/FAD-binding protein YdhS
MEMPRVICVIGGGPRGTSVVERLIASAPELLGERRLHIEVIDPYPPGAGRIWRTDQPDHLLMNTLAAQATLFTDDTVECAGPVVEGPALYEWATERGAALQPWSHPSRALLGRYYEWVFAWATGRAPGQVSVSVRRSRAVAIRDMKVLTEEGAPIDADAIILTTGHSDLVLSTEQRALADFAAARDLVYIPPAHPLDLDLDRVRPGETVLVRGFGMNFFDLMSLLITGRGGRFETDGTYRPSGREPVLAVGSRSGVPYRAKPVYGALPPVWPPRHFTDEFAQDASGPLDFRRDIWPLITRDAREAHVAAGGDGRLDFRALERPLDGAIFKDEADLTKRLLAHIRADLAEARKGAGSPVKAAASSIGASRVLLQRLMARGALDPRTAAGDVAGWFRGFAGALASGPPASRIAELVALSDAGLIRFAGPGMKLEADHDAGLFASRSAGGAPIRARVAIEARLPTTDVRRTTDPLLADLIATGQVRAAGASLDVTASPRRVVGVDGRPQRAIFALGVPLEGTQFLTALGPAPRAASVFLAETDAVARAALRELLG